RAGEAAADDPHGSSAAGANPAPRDAGGDSSAGQRDRAARADPAERARTADRRPPGREPRLPAPPAPVVARHRGVRGREVDIAPRCDAGLPSDARDAGLGARAARATLGPLARRGGSRAATRHATHPLLGQRRGPRQDRTAARALRWRAGRATLGEWPLTP